MDETKVPYSVNALYYSDPVRLTAFLSEFADVLDVPIDNLDYSTELGSRWLGKIPGQWLDEVKSSCRPSLLYARSTAQTVRVTEGMLPPGALEPSPETSTLRSVLMFREELKRRAVEVTRGPKANNRKSDKKSADKSAASLTTTVPPSLVAAAVNTALEKSNGPHPHSADLSMADRIPQHELVLTVRVYRQFTKNSRYRATISGEYVLLGCHPLTALRDAIFCESDYASLAGDLSDQAHDLPQRLPLAMDRYKSGYFFINETFYDDMRSPESIKLSEQVVAAAQSEKLSFETGDMATTRFSELTIRLGYPYLYVHQGNCEHLVVFSDMRLFNSSTDCPVKSCYPILTRKYQIYRKPCMCCWHLGAKWAVANCLLCPEDPTLMCGTCVDRLLYDAQGNKLPEAGAFRLYALPSVSLGTVSADIITTGDEEDSKYNSGNNNNADISTVTQENDDTINNTTTNNDDTIDDDDDDDGLEDGHDGDNSLGDGDDTFDGDES